jgi:hypothetical protein
MKMTPLLKLIDNDMNTLYHHLNRLNRLIRLSSLTAQTDGTAQAVGIDQVVGTLLFICALSSENPYTMNQYKVATKIVF